MQEIDIAFIKKKSLAGVVALTTRTFVLQIISFFSTFLLTIFLSPAIFGIFYIVSAIISFLGYFSDIGLAAALIQKKEELKREDLITTFTIQQVLVGIVVILSLILSQAIISFYHLDTAGLWLFRALVASFFLSSLKTIPSVLLERRLEFNKLVIPTITETISFYLVAVTLAWQGWGITSFTWAVIARGVVGLITMYLVSPWGLAFGFSPVAARRLLHFGLPFQVNSFIALIKDDLFTVFLGKALPFAQVGYIGWAKKWAEVPLKLIMDGVIRVTFPAFSRLQETPAVLGRAIGKTIFGLAGTMFPITVGMLFFIRPIVELVPRYSKWEPALPSFYIFALGAALAGLTTPLTNTLNAVGRIKITLGLMVFWTIATWVLAIWFISLFGFNGVAVAMTLITGSIVIVVKLTQNVAPFSFGRMIMTPLLAALLQGTWYFWFMGVAPYNPLRLIMVFLGGVILYAGVLWIFESQRIKDLLPKNI